VALPIAEAEDLIASLPGVISARIVEVDGGGAGDVHVLTGMEVPPKQTVRNVESALLAHFGVRIDHRKISVATTTDAGRARAPRPTPTATPVVPTPAEDLSRRVCFDDVEVRRTSRAAWCRVTLRQGSETVEAEAESLAGSRAHPEEIAARATLSALSQLVPDATALSLEGAQIVHAFGREFVFAGVTVRQGRATTLLAGSAEVRDSVEISAALAVLDATNRWVSRGK
jgi:hypothetical protein